VPLFVINVLTQQLAERLITTRAQEMRKIHKWQKQTKIQIKKIRRNKLTALII